MTTSLKNGGGGTFLIFLFVLFIYQFMPVLNPLVVSTILFYDDPVQHFEL